MSLALLFQIATANSARQRAAPAQAQASHPVHLLGRVLLAHGRDSVPIGNARVILHRVGTDRQGPIDSIVSGSGGRFGLRFTADSGAVYLLSARWSGIEYFALPLDTQGSTSDVESVVVVFDTSSTAPIDIAARHIVVSAPAATGMRDVLDLIVLDNPGALTRVPAGMTRSTWQTVLPPRAANVRPGDSEFSAETIALHGDTLVLSAAVPPGTRDISIEYQIPADAATFEIPVGASIASANVLVEEPGATVTGGLVRADSELVNNGRKFTRWSGALTSGPSVLLRLPRATRLPTWLLPTLVGTFGLALAAIARIATRKPV